MAKTTAVASLLLALRSYAQSIIYSGTGFGTYYYNVEQVKACGSSFADQNKGPVECSLITPLSLEQINSNYLVAMNHSQLVGDMATYCGRRVIVSVNGVPSGLSLYIGDGCQRCGTGSASSDVWNANAAPGLDFSYSVLSMLSSSACTNGHVSISWEIVNETLYDFDTDGSGSQQGPVGGTFSGSSSHRATGVTAQVVQSASASPSPNPATFTNLAAAASATRKSSRPCTTGAWQCNVNTLEQCLDDSWTARVACPDGLTCQGGNFPFCAPVGYE